MSEQSEFDRGWDAAVQWCAETDRFVPRLHTLLDEIGAPAGDGSVESRVRRLAERSRHWHRRFATTHNELCDERDSLRQQLEAKERECEELANRLACISQSLTRTARERDEAIKRADAAGRDLVRCRDAKAEAFEHGDEKAQQHAALTLTYNNLVRDLGVALGKVSRDQQELLECVRGLAGRAKAAEKARDELRDKLRGDLARQLADGLDQIPIDEPADDSDARKECPGPSDLVAYEHREQRIDRCEERLDRLERALRKAVKYTEGFAEGSPAQWKYIRDALGDSDAER